MQRQPFWPANTAPRSNRLWHVIAHRRMLIFVSVVLLLLIGSSITEITVLAVSKSTHVHNAAPANTAVTSSKNDNFRTGQNNNETILNLTNVNANQFGKRVSYPVDGQVYAQPLYVPNVTIGGNTYNVVFVATEHGSVYAFDADQTSAVAPLWHTNFLNSGITTVTNTAVACNDIVPEYGITGTPVIDTATGTLYVVVNTQESSDLDSGNIYRLHALDITTGQDKITPKVIQASVTGTGGGSLNGKVNFLPRRQLQRGGLTLYNGNVYMDFGSHCDNDPYHGWIMSYNASTLQQTAVYNTTPNGARAGMWQAGSGLAIDNNGSIFISSGNGTFNLNTGGTEAGDTIARINTNGLTRTDYFAPFNQSCLEAADADLGSGGVLLLPTSNRLINAGKEGRIYVIDRSNMGKYNTIADPCNNQGRSDVDKIVQELPRGTIGGMYSTPAYWSGPTGEFVYFSGTSAATKAFKLTNGLLSTSPTSQTPESFGFTGGNPSISSNGASNGILWLIDPGSALRAYDATNISNELYNSNLNATRDKLDSYVKFSVPTIANGKVFAGTKTSLTIYGLLGQTPTPTATTTASVTPPPDQGPVYNNTGTSNDSNTTTADYDHGGYSYSAQALQAAGINPGDHAFFNNFVYIWPDRLAGQANNYEANGQTIPITPVNNATTLGFLGSATNGAASGTATITYTDNSTQNFTLGFTDWAVKNVSFNNSIALTMPYRNGRIGRQNINMYVFDAEVVLQAGKTIKSVTLPQTVQGGQLHVFSISTKSTSVAPGFNNSGTSDDAAVNAANYDGGSSSYSEQALAATGIKPGKFVVFNGVTFTWAAPASGAMNNYMVEGQALPVDPVDGASKLAFLGSATNGPSTGTATITYTDNTTQTFTLGFADWTLNGGKTTTPNYGNSIVSTMSYRNNLRVRGKENVKTYIFYTEVALLAGKTVKSVTLPTTQNQGHLHVFTIATK